MVFYKNYCKELIVEYPVQDCFITSLCVADGWLFAATSKGSIRVYKWPIREAQCEMEVVSLEQKAVKLKHPRFQEYFFWSDQQKIINLHKLAFGNKLVVVRDGGIMSVISYHKFHLQKFEEAGQRKKLTQIINDTFFITKNEAEKRNRLIDKTESDILKIQNEIAKEKSMLERKYAEECCQVEKTFEQKIDLQTHQKNQYLNKILQENRQLRDQIQLKQQSFEMKRDNTAMLYQRKKDYEDNRNDTIKQEIQCIVKEHKAKIAGKIQGHKKDISDLKALYREKVTQMKEQFQQMIAEDYPSLLSIKNVSNKSKTSEEARGKKCSIKLPKEKKKFENLELDIKDREIIQLNERVEEIQQQNSTLQSQLEELQKKVRYAQLDDQNLQKQFQKCLEQYNSNRFTNLSLHSEVLKMRTQLLERKQIMQNKQDVINVAYQERQKLQNYKQLVNGSLTKLQERREGLEKFNMQKENQMAAIFAELASNLDEYQRVKREDQRLNELMKVYQKDKKYEEGRIQKAVNRLKELKRYLLLQGLTQDVEQKQMYLQQQNLLTSINFYRKRMSMETIKQKKNKMLKKSALNLVLKQNKNLLEEVNQLREETINHQHEINNLGKKIGEANRMLSIEYKLKDQKTEVKEQRNQLQAIRNLFNNEIASYNQVEEELKDDSVD